MKVETRSPDRSRRGDPTERRLGFRDGCSRRHRGEGFETYALTILYGQRHAIEREAAQRVARALGAARHCEQVIDLRAFGGSALTDSMEVPKDRDEQEMGSGIPITYVPARNTVFLSLRSPGPKRWERSISSSGSTALTTRVIRTADPSTLRRSRRWPISPPKRVSRDRADSGSTHRSCA